jgi:hypothetical protein
MQPNQPVVVRLAAALIAARARRRHQIEIVPHHLAGADRYARGLRVDSGGERAQRDFAGRHAREPKLAALIGERLEHRPRDGHAHLLQIAAGQGIRDAALDGTGVGGLRENAQRCGKESGCEREQCGAAESDQVGLHGVERAITSTDSATASPRRR